MRPDINRVVSIFNPDIDDFTVPYGRKNYTIRAMEIQQFKFFIADHIKKHLATHLMNKRGGAKDGNSETTLRAIRKEIEV